MWVSTLERGRGGLEGELVGGGARGEAWRLGTEATSRELALLGEPRVSRAEPQESSRGQRRWRGAEYPKGSM